MVKHLPAIQETQETEVQSLGREDSQEKEMATHSSILAWKIPWTEEPGGLLPWGCKVSDTSKHTHTHTQIHDKPITCPVAIALFFPSLIWVPATCCDQPCMVRGLNVVLFSKALQCYLVWILSRYSLLQDMEYSSPCS